MKKAIIAALAAALVCVTVAGAQGKTHVVHRYCVNVEQGTDYPSYGDLNLYRGSKRICLVGKPGKNGRNGKAGAKGAKGDAGAAGATGAKGDTGAAGATGAQGAQGEQGPAGANGATGPAGPQGEQGPAGQNGEPGPAGPTGPAGPQGEQGPPGPPGEPLGTIYACVSNGNNAKIVDSIDECDPGHDTIYKIDGVKVQP